MSTKIEWCDETWNPISGCSPISDACDHCYAKRRASLLAGRYGYHEKDPFRLTFHPDKLTVPLKWKKQRSIFICSMSDFFHPEVQRDWQEEVYRVIDKCPQHTFIFLTKRPENITSYWLGTRHNVRIGVTVESGKYYSRINKLLKIPASVRFISVEPALGPLLLDDYMPTLCFNSTALRQVANKKEPCLDWVIIGQETGPGARPARADWFNEIIAQCRAASVPVFVKKAPAGVEIIREFPNK